MPEDAAWAVIYSLAPTVLIGLLFWYIIRSVIRADSTERKVYAKIEAEERAKLEAEKASS